MPGPSEEQKRTLQSFISLWVHENRLETLLIVIDMNKAKLNEVAP